MQQLENRFKSDGIGESEIAYAHLYPSRWVLVNKIEGFGYW